MAALASYVPAAFLLEIMKDKRVPMRLYHLRVCLKEEMMFLGETKLQVWSWVASVCEWPGQRLQSEVLRAGHVAIAFVSAKTVGS